MDKEEQLARNHPAFPEFILYVELGEDNHSEECEFSDWGYNWNSFLAGWTAALKFNGLI